LTSADVTTEDACSGLDLVHLELLSPPYPSETFCSHVGAVPCDVTPCVDMQTTQIY